MEYAVIQWGRGTLATACSNGAVEGGLEVDSGGITSNKLQL
jgi:hypothetical protein